MPNYLELVGCHYDNAQAFVPGGGDPTVYGDLVWTTTPISQAELDSLDPCPSPEEIDLANFFSDLEGLVPGDTLVWDGTQFVAGPAGGGGGGIADKIFTIEFGTQSSIGDDWLHLDGNPSNETPHIVPWDCKLVAITFSNKESGADTKLQVNAVDEGDGKSPSPVVFEWIIDNARVARKTDFSPDVTFSKGDKIAIKARQRGNTDPSQVKVILYLTITAADETNNIENYSGNIS